MTGTAAQVEWAERIRLTVDQEFDRVAKVFEAQVVIQTGAKQTETRTIIGILEQKRVDTLANLRAGYFIREWQELSDQVRQLIAKDPRYLDIRDQRATRAAQLLFDRIAAGKAETKISTQPCMTA